jgi:hypothetical protein
MLHESATRVAPSRAARELPPSQTGGPPRQRGPETEGQIPGIGEPREIAGLRGLPGPAHDRRHLLELATASLQRLSMDLELEGIPPCGKPEDEPAAGQGVMPPIDRVTNDTANVANDARSPTVLDRMPQILVPTFVLSTVYRLPSCERRCAEVRRRRPGRVAGPATRTRRIIASKIKFLISDGTV